MLKAYKKTLMGWLNLTSVIAITLFVILTSCSYLSLRPEAKPMTEREYIYEKGKALFDSDEYEKSLPFFLKISMQPGVLKDSLYPKSLWNLSVVYEKLGWPEKALLALQELAKLDQDDHSLFKIQLAQMKNNFRVSNEYQAYEVRKQIDAGFPLAHYTIDEIYRDLIATTSLNYDRLMLEEIQYMSEIQKYFVYVMESNRDPINAEATNLLTSFTDHTYSLINNPKLDKEFRKKIAESLLDYLRRFDSYKIDDLNLNLNTISKFSIYSEQKQKLITEWLHQ